MDLTIFKICAFLGAGISIGFGAIGSGLGEGMIAMQASKNLGRQPGASGKLLRTMVISQAVCETPAIFALVIAFLLLFKSPENATLVQSIALLGAGITMGLGAIGSGIGSGLPGVSASNSIGRNPATTNTTIILMIISQTIAQTSSIFALTIALTMYSKVFPNTIVSIGAIIGAAISMGAGATAAIGVGTVGKFAADAVGRHPQDSTVLTRTLLIGAAVTETVVIYALVIAILLVFVAV